MTGLLLVAPHPSVEPWGALRTRDKARSPTCRHTGHPVRGTQTMIPCRDPLQPPLLGQASSWLFSPIPARFSKVVAAMGQQGCDTGTLPPALGAVTHPHTPAVPIPVPLSPLGLDGGCPPWLPAQPGAIPGFGHTRGHLSAPRSLRCCWLPAGSGSCSAQLCLQAQHGSCPWLQSLAPFLPCLQAELSPEQP